MGNRTKVLQHSKSRHNITNPDKPKLVNYNRSYVKYAILRFSKCKILVGKTLTIQHAFIKFRQTFPSSKFCTIRYLKTGPSFVDLTWLHGDWYQ